jgi:hypothetical protein
MVLGNGGFSKFLYWLLPKNGHVIERLKKNCGRSKYLFVCSWRFLVCGCNNLVMISILLFGRNARNWILSFFLISILFHYTLEFEGQIVVEQEHK